MYWAMVLVRLKVAVGSCSGIVEYLTSDTRYKLKRWIFCFQGYKHTIYLTHDKIEGMSKREGVEGSRYPRA